MIDSRVFAGCLGLLACSIVTQEGTRIVQEFPQRIEEVQSYEWCRSGVGDLSLVGRTFWRGDGKPTRNEKRDTPSSNSKVLWERPHNPAA